MKYSLSDYTLSISHSYGSYVQNPITIGGQGSAIGSIEISVDGTLWSTKGYATGAWVHNKNLDRTGTVTISINQLSSSVSYFATICKLYYQNTSDKPMTLILKGRDQKLIASMGDCYIQKIPSQSFGESANDQSWTFTCGTVTFE